MGEARLNPEISKATIGVRELKEITVYPLSMADQLKMTDLISAALDGFFRRDDAESDVEFAKFLADLIKDNLETILKMITDEGEADLDDITNNQAIDIAETVYEVNFGSLVKKVKSLLEKVKEQFPSGRPLPTSLDDMEDIDLKTSTDEASETEVSH